MSTTIQVRTRTAPSASTPTAAQQPAWKHGVAAAVVASVATTVLAAVASAAVRGPVRSRLPAWEFANLSSISTPRNGSGSGRISLPLSMNSFSTINNAERHLLARLRRLI